MTSLILIIVGVFIGWNIPQPKFAKTLQEKAIETLQNKGFIK